MIYTDSNGDKHEIETVHYPEQCEAYHKALEERDALAAHFLYISPVYISQKLIDAKIRIIELSAKHKRDTERIKSQDMNIVESELIWRSFQNR